MARRQTLAAIAAGVLALLLPTYAYALLTATGYGERPEEAREEALAALASSIYVRIESDARSYQNARGENYFESSTLATTRLPLIGATTTCSARGGDYRCDARMRREDALPLYQARIRELATSIRQDIERLDAVEEGRRYRLLTELLGRYDELSKYRTVRTYLSPEDGDGIEEIPWSVEELRGRLVELRSRVVSVELAVETLLEDVDRRAVAPHAPLPRDSREVTPFGRAILVELERQLGDRLNRTAPEYELVGHYERLEDGLELVYTLVDGDGRTLRTLVTQLDPTAYSDHRTEPEVVDFDRLLHAGYAISAEFDVQVNTNRGSRGLLFEAGSTVQLLVRLNQPGYFYIVGHTRNDQREFTYLLDLHNAPGGRRFVRFVGADEANRWISLGEFVVQPPYGTESVQIVASQADPVHDLPAHRYDPTTGYYVISEQITEGVAQVRTRALQRKQDTGTETAEAVLMFTTEE